ncbi:uncharacterized protein C8Q71DRAFT_804255 [Rhodofomes roseus]|uniref:Uncharacterized protein n=1 Tax=Rhodofomes roseus TaxID=34475 RepID=A0ABQ8KPV8_9APHY|nr:uncharacterized protein C8Q71DRAFT_804255 [Rhodofomes roseus]KAH9840652.1 hypothetical protein C8Q71DRAFT_804255 [Rhodofomes roseus]
MFDSNLDALFPLPSPPPSTKCPERLPGITHETNLAVTKTLRENHVQRHAFINDQGFHNHISHQILAVYALGGAASLYNAIYKTQEPMTRPYTASPSTITKETFNEHLGKLNYYDAYLLYFQRELEEKGASATIEEHIFSRAANFTGDALTRAMFDRFYARAYHPLIFVGYGLEFGLLGLVAEGLAQTACHPLEATKYFTASEFAALSEAGSSAVAQVTEKLSNLLLNSSAPAVPPKTSLGVHAFDIAARILKDDRFSAAKLGLKPHLDPAGAIAHYEKVADVLSADLLVMTEEWLPVGADLDQKIEELSWLCTLLYGVTGWSANNDFNADFFIMHVLTSSLFLPSFVEYLSPSSSVLLLRKHFITGVSWWIARGRPSLNIKEFYAGTSPDATLEPAVPKPSLAPAGTTPNPWLALVERAIVHPDDHVVKVQRALLHYSKAYGGRGRGTFEDTALEGAEVVDGTLFVRVAQLTAKRMGVEGTFWDFKGFFV